MIISPDALIQGPRTNESIAQAWAQARRLLRAALLDPAIKRVVLMAGIPGAGKSTWAAANDTEARVIFDACSTKPGFRRGVAEQAWRAGKRPELVWVRTPLAVARARNEERPAETRVPDVALSRAWVALRDSPPSRREGWSQIWTVRHREAA